MKLSVDVPCSALFRWSGIIKTWTALFPRLTIPVFKTGFVNTQGYRSGVC